MIAELDRYHGVVLRQILVACGRRMQVGVVDLSGRVDAFSVETAAFQVKHSSKRLSPWQFTYTSDALVELRELSSTFEPIWIFLVCGQDGVVGLSLKELNSIAQIGDAGTAWVRVSRNRKSMYRISGALGELSRAKPQGVHAFVDELSIPNCEALTI